MTRPSHNIDLLLFNTGEKLLIEVGFEKFSVRHLCKKAGVNLGMFHYYFKTKENFIELLFESLFNKHLECQKKAAEKHLRAKDKLKAVIYERAVMTLTNKQLITVFFKEILNRSFDKLLAKHKKEEMRFLIPIIEQCKKDKDIAQNLKIQHILPLILPAPNFAVATDLFRVADIDSDGNITMEKNADLKAYIDKLADLILRGLK